MSMSDEKLNSVSFLFDLPPQNKETKKICSVSVNTHDVDSITTKMNNNANLTTFIVEKYI